LAYLCVSNTILTAGMKVFQTVWSSEKPAKYLELAGEVKTVWNHMSLRQRGLKTQERFPPATVNFPKERLSAIYNKVGNSACSWPRRVLKYTCFLWIYYYTSSGKNLFVNYVLYWRQLRIYKCNFRTFMKFDIWGFFENFWENSGFIIIWDE